MFASWLALVPEQGLQSVNVRYLETSTGSAVVVRTSRPRVGAAVAETAAHNLGDTFFERS